jgi:hypothetical protein
MTMRSKRPNGPAVRSRMLESMLALRHAELDALERLVMARWSSGAVAGVAKLRPDLWVERVAELHRLAELARRLPDFVLVSEFGNAPRRA